MSVLIDITHEIGDLSEYTATVVDGGDLAVSANAALVGTGYGLEVVIDDTTGIYGQYSLGTASTTGIVRFRFYIDPNGISIPTSDYIRTVSLYTSGSALALNVRFYGGTHRIRTGWIRDGGTGIGSYMPITDAPHYVEVEIKRATSAVSLDGYVKTWIDGVLSDDQTGIDNYDTFVDFHRLQIGASSVSDPLTSGTFYLDQMVVNDDGSTIGPYTPTGPVDLTIENASHNHASGTLSLVQLHALDVLAASHPTSADSGSITVYYDLDLLNASHAHAADDVSLSVVSTEFILELDSATHNHAAEAVDVSQVQSIEVADLGHAHSVSDVSIEEVAAVDMVVDSTSHGHTTDDIGLILVCGEMPDTEIGGVSAVSGTMLAVRFLEAEITPSTVVAAVPAYALGNLEAETAGASSVVGDAYTAPALAAEVAISVTVTAFLERYRSISASIESGTAVEAGASMRGGFAGSVDGSSDVEALLGMDRPIASMITMNAAVAASAETGGTILQDIYMQVTGAPVFNDDADPVTGVPGTWTIPVTLRRGGESGTRIPTGAAVVKWGEYADTPTAEFTGGIILTSDLDNAPYVDVFTVAKNDNGVMPWDDAALKPRVRMGNLLGVLGNVVDKWGIAMSTDLSDTAAPYIEASNEGLVIKDADLTIINGDLYAGDLAETSFMRWLTDSASLEVRGTIVAQSGSIEGVLSLGSLGGIYQGTGTFDAPDTGLKIWNNGGVGQITGYSNGVEQAYFGADGKLYAGGGYVQLGENGIDIEQSSVWWEPSRSINFINEYGDRFAYMFGQAAGPLITSMDLYLGADGGGTPSNVELKARSSWLTQAWLVAQHTGGDGEARVSAVSGMGNNYVAITATNTDISGNLRYTGALQRYTGGSYYSGLVYVPVDTAVLYPGWDGTASMAVGTYTPNVANFGLPVGTYGVRAVTVLISGSWTAQNGGYWSSVRSTSGGISSYGIIRAYVANIPIGDQVTVPVDASGNFIVAVGGLQMDAAVLRLGGYYI